MPGPEQTFLPCAGFTASVRTLDRRRLGKQRMEALQVLRALVIPGYGWTRYGLEVCELGAADTCAAKLAGEFTRSAGGGAAVRTPAELAAAGEVPPWLGTKRSTSATGRRWCGKTRTTTPRSSRGRRRPALRVAAVGPAALLEPVPAEGGAVLPEPAPAESSTGRTA